MIIVLSRDAYGYVSVETDDLNDLFVKANDSLEGCLALNGYPDEHIAVITAKQKELMADV